MKWLITTCLLTTICTSMAYGQQNNHRLTISKLQLIPIADYRSDNRFHYKIEIELKNEGITPLFFWSHTCSWQRNFIFKARNVFFDNVCFSNATLIELLLPKTVKKYLGEITSNGQIDLKNSLVQFCFFNALIVSQREYIISELKNVSMKNIKPDTISSNAQFSPSLSPVGR